MARKIFNPEIFLEIAKGINESNDLDEQGKFRTAIGRAYYAAFLTTREYLKSHKAKKFNKERQHQDVLDALDEFEEYYLKNMLDKLRDNRVNADYFLNVLIDMNLCEKCLIISEQIINSVEGI